MPDSYSGQFSNDEWDAVASVLDNGVPVANADDLSISGRQVQTTLDGFLVPVSSGLGINDAVDPSASTTPISDARDAIVTNGSGEGAILYPPENITEAATFTQSTAKIAHIGWGTQVSAVEFTDLSGNGYEWEDSDLVWFDGIEVSGHDDANRTGGSAWRFTASAMSDFNVGRVAFRKWAGPDPVIHFDTGHVFSSNWFKLRAGSLNEGTFFAAHDSFGPGFHLGNIRASIGTKDPILDITDGAGGFVSDVGFSIGSLNIGGSSGEAVVSRIQNGDGHIDEITWFGSSVTAIVDALAGAGISINSVRAAGGATVDAIYRTSGSHSGRYPVPQDANVTVSVNRLEVESDVTVEPNIYEGGSADVTNNSGGSLSEPVSCLGDLTLVS